MKIKKILCVDDDPGIRKLYQEILTSQGYEVFLAENGIECGCLLPKIKPDLVMFDLTMPEMGGIKAIKILSEGAGKFLYYLVVSGNIHDKEMEFLREKKIPWLHKPIDFRALLETLKSLEETNPPCADS